MREPTTLFVPGFYPASPAAPERAVGLCRVENRHEGVTM